MTALGREALGRMKIKKAGFLTKIVVLILLVAGAICLMKIQGKIAGAQSERDELQLQLNRQTQVNADLKDAVEHSGDRERQVDLARDKLGLAAPGEKVIIFTD